MRYALFAFLLSVASPVLAQKTTAVEVGTSVGAMFLIPGGGGDAEIVLSAPTGAFLGLGSIYVSIISNQQFMIEPQVLFHYDSIDEEVLFSGMLQLGLLLNPEAKGSPYVAIHGGYLTLSDDSNSPALGAALGVRNKLGTSAAIRIEARYRNYLDDSFDLHELTLGVGIGAVL